MNTPTPNQLPSDILKRFNEELTFGGITGTVALKNGEDPRLVREFIAKEIDLSAQKERERIVEKALNNEAWLNTEVNKLRKLLEQ